MLYKKNYYCTTANSFSIVKSIVYLWNTTVFMIHHDFLINHTFKIFIWLRGSNHLHDETLGYIQIHQYMQLLCQYDWPLLPVSSALRY